MGHSWTCYATDSGISQTHINTILDTGTKSHTRYYNDAPYTLTNIPNGNYYKSYFTAIPADDFEFWRWEYVESKYEIKSPFTGSYSYNYNTTFTYYTLYDMYLYIRARSIPKPFEWDSIKTQGKEFKLTAEEWKKLGSKIQNVIDWKGIAFTVNLTGITPGSVFRAEDYNYFRSGIQYIGAGAGSYIPEVAKGTPITADTSSSVPEKNNINIIVNELNAVITNGR